VDHEFLILLDAIDTYYGAKRRYDKAAEKYTGTSPAYWLRDEHDAWDEAKAKLRQAFDDYVTSLIDKREKQKHG